MSIKEVYTIFIYKFTAINNNNEIIKNSIIVDNDEELAILKDAINEALEERRQNVTFKEADLDIEDAKFMAEIAEKQLRQPHKRTPWALTTKR